MARKITSATQKIMAYMERNPDAKPARIAKALKVPVVQVYSVRTKMNKQAAPIPVVLDEVTNIKPAEWKTIAYAITTGRTRVEEPKGFWAKVVGWFK